MSEEKFIKSINWQLFLALLLMVACFFTWSENVAITRVIKVIGRLGMLLVSWILYKRILNYGAVDSLKWHHPLPLILYAAYLLLGLASFLWSSDVGVSALQWFMTSQTLVFCYFFIKSIYLLDFYFPNHNVRLYNLLGNTCFVLNLVFVIGMYVAPNVFFRMTMGGEEARLGGYIMNPNELGMLAGVGVASLLFDLRRGHKKVWTVVKIVVLFVSLYYTGSRSSLIGALLIVGFFAMLSENKKIKITILAGMIVLAPFAIYTMVLKGGDSSRLEEVMSMTGRLPFWTALLNEGLPREPLLGFGFMRIDYKDFFQSVHTYPGKMTHNTFMQVLMNLGLIGFVIVLFQVFFTIKTMLEQEKEKKYMLIAIFIPILINSMTEFGIFGENNYGILFYQLIIMYISFNQSPILTPEQKMYMKLRRPQFNLDLLYKDKQ